MTVRSSMNMLGRLSPSLLSQGPLGAVPRPLNLTDDELEPPVAAGPDTAKWHGDGNSYVPGLNSLCDLYAIWHDFQVSPPENHTERYMVECFSRVEKVIDDLPVELRWRGGLSRRSTATPCHDIQIVNIFITSLHIRSNLLQNLGAAGDDITEHQRIMDDVLEVLYHLPREAFDANGSSLVPKVRDIGAAYLERVRAGGHATQEHVVGAQNKLARLLRKLDDLDCWQGHGVLNGFRISGAELTPLF